MQTGSATRRLARQIAEAADLDGFFAANRDRIAPETIADLKDEVDRLVRVDLTRAEPLAHATHRLAWLLDDPVSLGYGDAAIAQVYQQVGRLADAQPLYESAIERLRGAGKKTEAAGIERQLVAILTRQGRAKEALEIAGRARRTLAKAGDRTRLAQLENNVGTLYYYVLERYRKALEHFTRAETLLEQLADPHSLAIVEYNRANVLLELDRPYEAIALYEKAERLHAGAGHRLFATKCSYMAAFGYAVLGRYNEALKRFYAARESFLEIGDKVSAAWASLCLAELYLRLNVTSEAETLATAAIEEFSAADGQEIEAGRALVVRARVHERRRDYDSAAAEMRRAQEIFDRLGMVVLGADIRLAQAELALVTGDPEIASRLSAEAADTYKRLRLTGRRARARLAQAGATRALGDAAAMRHVRAALGAAARTGDPWIECQAETLAGEIALERGRRDEGTAALERAVAGVERLRLRLKPGEARAAFLGDKLRAYERLVAVYLERGDAESLRRAFRYVEMAKSRALADLMAQHLGVAREGGRRETRVRGQLARRLEELNWYSSRIDTHDEKGGQRNTRLDAHLRAELARCERDLSSLFHRLEVEDSELAGLLAAEPTGLDELADVLEADETVVEFFVASGRVSAFVVSNDGVSAHTSYADAAKVERSLTGLRFQMEKFGLGHSYARAHRAALRRCADNYLESLYEELLAPLAAKIEGRRLVVIPHGILHYVPFHALRRAADGRYVIEENEVSYAPSATVHRLCALRPARRDGVTSLLAVGLSDASAPHIAEELASIARCFPDAVRLEGERASKLAFLDHAPRSRFLHLATHGFFRQDNPMFSSVRLADGPLNFYDVFDLELDAELVTLSACNTGLNKLSPGDELSGLMRGFLYAGAPSLMVSLWAVNDRSTSELMQSFYRHLSGGATKRGALRSAQLEALERYGHPYYWAPFILMGKV